MVFASGIFLFYFLPLFLVIYAISPRRVKNLVLALASYVFYGWWRPDFVVLMWISTMVDFGCGRAIAKARQAGSRGKGWVVLSVLVNLGLLGYFKYANFGIDTLNAIVEPFGLGPMQWAEVVLPVGISFYTFQTLSYTVDVYRGTTPAVASVRDFIVLRRHVPPAGCRSHRPLQHGGRPAGVAHPFGRQALPRSPGLRGRSGEEDPDRGHSRPGC